MTWQAWLLQYFPYICVAPFADRHIRLWNWIESLERGERAKSFIAVWPRGGAKSTTVELAAARLCVTLKRRFVLYVSETQEQADRHVQAIASLLEKLGVERAVNQYGSSKGWKRQELRTANGFNIAAFGLDTGARGVKLDEFRPDLIVLDDIDALHDTLKTTQKKQDILTSTLIPAGSADCAFLFVQNRIHEFSLISQIADGIADFLHDREPVSEEPAITGLLIGTQTQADGTNRYVITAGEATWQGQSLSTCEQQINDMGERAFRREAQHEVEGAAGIFFNTKALRYCKIDELPAFSSVCIAGDLAATEAGGDYTALSIMGRAATGYYVLGVVRGQWSSERVRAAIGYAGDYYKSLYPKIKMHLPQDPSQAGKDQAEQLRATFARFSPLIESVRGDKSTRASGFADEMNKGNVYLVEQPLPAFVTDALPSGKPLMRSASVLDWHRALLVELKSFRENELDQVDDQVDAMADAYNDLHSGSWGTDADTMAWMVKRGK